MTTHRPPDRLAWFAGLIAFAIAMAALGALAFAGAARVAASSGYITSAAARALHAVRDRRLLADARSPSHASTPLATTRIDPYLPRIDAAMKTTLRRLVGVGQAHGARAGVFVKLGDSITESASFLKDIGHGWYDLDAYRTLEQTIAFFRATPTDREGNDSFARASDAAVAGWTSDHALAGPPPNAIAREIDALHPSLAFIMFGTNDVNRSDVPTLAHNLSRIVDECVSRGVIPVLSTIPDRLDAPTAHDRVPSFNAAIVQVARTRQVPLIDLNGALTPLPRHGLNTDGVHPSAWIAPDGAVRAATFSSTALQFGYNVRNLLSLLTLEKVRRIAFDDGAADP